ncbi:MAG: sigma-54-dependent Fis family transcriptional regulator [Candidatus Marinimicrobia bacterium]|nr:sigma-54-dependent Fis family transcriptional regulator [Candidatus Neomarinimicrobiota bacterium]
MKFKNDNVIRIIVLEDEAFDVKRIENTLRTMNREYKINGVFSDGEDFLEYLRKNKYENDVVIMDYQISGNIFGEELIKKIKEIDPFLQIVIITKMTINTNDVYFANELMKSGACWYGTKYPVDIDNYIYQPTDFILAILNAYERKRLEVEKCRSNKKMEKNVDNILNNNQIIGISEEINKINRLIDKYAKSDANVLITGESGVGKELIALHIHYKSRRRFENYVTVNCAAIPNELIESELFGYTKGSFTGARESKAGLFEQANGGTIFLDEIGEMPIGAQAKLLRVIETGELQKIGREKKYKVDVRIISATNANINKALEEKKIREDLFYRLNVLNIDVKPLRERIEDIPILVEYFLDKFSAEYNVKKPRIEKSAIEYLKSYKWPGNVRQLRNFCQRLLLNEVEVLNYSVVTELLEGRTPENNRLINVDLLKNGILPLKDFETRAKSEYIKFVRSICRSDAEAARKLSIAPPNYHRLCKDLGLK